MFKILQVDTTNFDLPGHLTGPADTMLTHEARVVSRARGLLPRRQAILDFTDSFSAPGSADDLQVAVLKVFWRSDLAITRKKGAFKVKVSDVIKFSSDRDRQILSLEDVGKIPCRDAANDTRWSDR